MTATELILNSAVIAFKETLTLDEVSQYTGYSKGTITNMTSQRTIPHYKRGKNVFFRRTEIDSWLTENKVETVEAMAEQHLKKFRS